MSTAPAGAIASANTASSQTARHGPQRIGRVVIVPLAFEQQRIPGDVPVILRPGLAFGSGLHPTTRACIRLLQDLQPMPSDVLDVGCGSGILALSAIALGARRAVGYDTDAVSKQNQPLSPTAPNLAASAPAADEPPELGMPIESGGE